MTFRMTLHSKPCFRSSPSHLQILRPKAGGLGSATSTEVTPSDIYLMTFGAHPTQLMLCPTLISPMSPLNNWWPLVYTAGMSGSEIVTQEVNELDWSTLEASDTCKKGGRIEAHMLGYWPLRSAPSHPAQPSPQWSVSGPGIVGLPVRAEGGMEPKASTGRMPASLGDSLN